MVTGNLNLDELNGLHSSRYTFSYANGKRITKQELFFPIERLSLVVKERDPNIVFHTDATQYVGKLPVNLNCAF